MTLDDAASILDVSEAQVKRLAGAGQIGNSYFKKANTLSGTKGREGVWIIDGRAVRKRRAQLLKSRR